MRNVRRNLGTERSTERAFEVGGRGGANLFKQIQTVKALRLLVSYLLLR